MGFVIGGAPSASFERAVTVCCYGKEQLLCHNTGNALPNRIRQSFLSLFSDFRWPELYRRPAIGVHSDSQNPQLLFRFGTD
jgi:hypothetical protein